MLIRKYKKSDRKAVERINFETGFLGRSMRELITTQDLWSNTVSYYIEKEPESAFVVVADKKVVGYLLGSISKRKTHLLKYYLKTFLRGLFALRKLKTNDFLYWSGKYVYFYKSLVRRYGRQRIRTPKKAGHFHIDILPGYRGGDIGSKLLRKFLRYAKSKGVKKIYANSYQTHLNPNTNFWLKNGFKEYDRIRTYVWEDQLPKEKIYFVCFVKELG